MSFVHRLQNHIDPLKGESLQTKKAFQHWYNEAKVSQIRYISFLTAALYLLYARLDQSVAPAQVQATMVIIHGYLLPLLLLVIGAMSFFPFLHSMMRKTLTVAPIGAAGANLYLAIGSGNFFLYAPELYLIIVWTLTISGLPLRFATFSALATTALVTLFTLWYPFEKDIISMHFLWVLSSFSFGFLNALVMERTYKSLFLRQRSLELSATVDGLTSIWNRYKIENIFNDEMLRTRRYGKGFSVILLDIDHFKEVNDSYGHAAGDVLLKEFSSVLRQGVRQTDHIGRFGGEEFLIILPETALQQALTVAKSLKEKINGYRFTSIGYKTASFGVTQYHKGETMLETMNRADKALYLAKNNGRDRIESL